MITQQNLLQNIRWQAHDDALLAVNDSTGATAKANEALTALTEARFARIDPIDGDVLVEVGSSLSNPGLPVVMSRRIRAGCPEVVQCHQAGVPWVRLLSVSGDITVAITWGI